MKKKFKIKYLKEELNLPCRAIEDNILSHGRWNALHEIIFQDKDGKYWKAIYFCGLTKNQIEQPWDPRKEIECEEVELKWIMSEEWVPVKEEEKNG